MKVNATYDTETKELSVTQDGVSVDNLYCLEFYQSYYDRDEVNKYPFAMRLVQSEDNKGVTKRIETMAKLLGYKNEN